MANIITHTLVAEKVSGDNPDAIVGSTLYDFRGMYHDYRGVRLAKSDFRHSADLLLGLWLHKRTDDVYDSVRERNKLVKELTQELDEVLPDCSYRTRYACADNATDILLDGILLAEPLNTAVYNRTRNWVIGEETALSDIEEVEFSNMVREYFWNNVAHRYRNPETVATMLYARFLSRKRQTFAFHEDSIPFVAEAFDRQIERIKPVASTILNMTIDGVREILQEAEQTIEI